MDRCTNCVLPANYPGIKLNEKGACQYCTQKQEEIHYVGLEPLVKEIRAFQETKKDRNKKYDCVIGFSGGRDSTYLLYTLKKLGLNVLCFSANHGYIPEQTEINMKYATDKLNADLVTEHYNFLEKSLKHVVSSWIHRPSMPMIETFCTGCKQGVILKVSKYAKKNNIPILIWGETPFEFPHYRYNLMKLYDSEGWLPMILGYSTCVAKNPRWFTNLFYVDTQIKDFLLFYDIKNYFKKKGLLFLEPFLENIRWEEKKVMSTIENELNWKKNPKVKSSWRGDCSIALLKLYAYNHILGFNDKVEGLSYLIRDGQITRDEALNRIAEEEQVPDEAIKEVLERIGLKLSDFKNAVEKARKNYSKGIRF